MAIYKVHKTSNYTVMSNHHLRDKNISLKAKGLLSVMLSLPDDWDYSINGLVAICKENNTAVESALKELKAQGYLIVTKKMPNETDSGRIEYEYDIYESPQEAEKQRVEKQGVEKLPIEKQGVENSPQLNTYKSITKESNKKELNTDNIYKKAVDYLNDKAKTKYRASTPKTKQFIHARLSEGFTLEDFRTVIDKKCNEWLGTDMAQYLRPETLFGTKFESYLNAPARTKKTYGANGVEILQPEEDILDGIF